MTVTSHDVARLAGVSQPTVSRALRDLPGVSAHTRARVREAARSLGYVTSQTGRALATRRTRKIGVISAELSNPFYPALLGPLQDALQAGGYRTVLFTDRDDRPVELGPLLDGSLDGVVLTTSATTSALPHELAARGVPFVMANRSVDGVDADSCVVDNRAGAAAAADLLVELGHSRVAAIMGPRATSTGRERADGFAERLAAHGIQIPPGRMLHGPFAATTGRRGLTELLTCAEPPTAVFCGNDVIALGVLDAATAMRLDVPASLTVIGFDDIPMAAWSSFELTTMHVDLAELARAVAATMVRRLEDPGATPRRTVLQPTLVARRTHGPATGVTRPPPARDAAGPSSLRSWMSAVSDIARAVNAAQPLDVLLTKVAQQACALIGFDYCAVMLADESGERVTVAGWHGLSSDYVALVRDGGALLVHPPGSAMDSPAARAYRERRTIAVPDVQVASAYGRMMLLAPTQGYRSLVASPLRGSGTVRGLLVGYRDERHDFTAPEIELVELLAEQTAIALQAAWLRREQQEVIGELSGANDELRRGREQLDWAERQHRRLMQLVLDDVGLDGVAAALAEILHSSITIEESGGTILASAAEGDYVPPPPARPRSWTEVLGGTAGSGGGHIAGGYEVVRLRGTGSETWVAPVVLGGELVGRLWVTGLSEALNPWQRRAIERFALVVGVEVLKRRHLLAVEERLSGDLLADLLRPDGIAQPRAVMDRAAALGLNLADPHWLGLLLVAPDAGAPIRVSGAVRDAVGAAASFMIGRYDDAAVVLVPARVDPIAIMRRIGEAVAARHDPDPVLVVGPLVDDPAGYAQAYRLAANAARLRPSGRGGVLDLRKVGITALLLRSELPPAELRRFAEESLSALRTHDDRRQADLIGTLRSWLAAGCSTSATAEALVVHVNTVAYRLSRIEELTGRDLRRFEVRLELQLAVLVWDVMHLDAV